MDERKNITEVIELVCADLADLCLTIGTLGQEISMASDIFTVSPLECEEGEGVVH